MTVEKLVAELGGVCTAMEEVRGLVDLEPAIDESLTEATRAVTAVIADPAPEVDDPTQADEVVREAWAAIAVAKDWIARLSQEVERSRLLRDRAQALKDHASGLRRGGRGRG
jgi:hypothetical protein